MSPETINKKVLMPRKTKKLVGGGVCLCPKGLTLPNSKKRLNETPEDMRAKDPEHIMASLWEELNTRDRCINLGRVPIESILHTCNEGCGKPGFLNSPTSAHFYNGNLEKRDLEVAAATVQWLATNVGRAFLDRFSDAFKKARGIKT